MELPYGAKCAGLVHNALLAIPRCVSNCGRQESGKLLFGVVEPPLETIDDAVNVHSDN